MTTWINVDWDELTPPNHTTAWVQLDETFMLRLNGDGSYETVAWYQLPKILDAGPNTWKRL